MELPTTKSSQSATRSVSDCNNSSDWLNRICEIQRQKATPVLLETLREKATKQKRAMKSYKAADIMERCNAVSSRSQTNNLRKAYYMSPSFAMMSAPPSSSLARGPISALPPPAPSADYERNMEMLSAKSSSAAFNVQQVLRTCRTDIVQENADDNLDDATAQLEQLEAEADEEETESAALPAALGVTAASDSAQGAPVGFYDLLESLSVEPTDAAEMATKFSVFENFLSTVVAIREQTIAFWEENKDQFDGASRRAGEKSIKDIDNVNSLSIVESTSKWFVYFMLKKAHGNSLAISNTLAAIKSRLELLTKEDIECPFCLDPILSEDCLVLGCCHKTCRTCWTNWQEIKGTAAFCPLCRHEEFVQQVLV